jgi:hypothetical protein
MAHRKHPRRNSEHDLLGGMNDVMKTTTEAAVAFTGMAVVTNMSGQIIKKL